ncbi:restriction endonuclease subunit S [Campylobacter sp. P0109]|uniref:restriction endonuclease subunit S n=1 Tax=Campylobacter sp. P0109 TaxID=1895606 RepID=UPI00191C749F|nr:restriction endonuclease subunit S [Campylobacter sp. P0109]
MAKIKKDTNLRKSILQAAITGQLISNVEGETKTGKELLDKIIEERNAKLLAQWEEAKKKNPKAKKPAPIVASEITEDEIPFEIPKNWCWCRLGDVGDWKAGSTPSRSNPEFYNGNIPWLKTGDLTDDFVDIIPECISEIALKSCSMRLNPVGSVLIAMYGATIGKLGILNIEATTNQACCACITHEPISNKYMFYYLMSQKKALTEKAEGGAQPNISREKLVIYPFPLPPLAVQNAIVAKLEEVLPLVDAYENAVLQKEELKTALPDKVKKAILQEAIQGKLTESWRKTTTIEESGKQLLDKIIEERNKKLLAQWEEAKKKNPKAKKPAPIVASEITEDEIPFEIPKSWCWCRLSEYLDIRDGTHDSPKFYDTGIPFVTSKNLNNGKLDFSVCKYITEEDHKKFSARSFVEDGDILFAMIGSIGNPVMVKKEFDFSFKNMALFKCYSKENTNMKYIYFYLCHIQKELKEIATGGVQSFIGLGTFREMIFPLPPLAEQEKIVEIIEQMLPLCEKFGG